MRIQQERRRRQALRLHMALSQFKVEAISANFAVISGEGSDCFDSLFELGEKVQGCCKSQEIVRYVNESIISDSPIDFCLQLHDQVATVYDSVGKQRFDDEWSRLSGLATKLAMASDIHIDRESETKGPKLTSREITKKRNACGVRNAELMDSGNRNKERLAILKDEFPELELSKEKLESINRGHRNRENARQNRSRNKPM